MSIPPTLSGALAQERHADLLREAEHYRLVHEAKRHRRATRPSRRRRFDLLLATLGRRASDAVPRRRAGYPARLAQDTSKVSK